MILMSLFVIDEERYTQEWVAAPDMIGAIHTWRMRPRVTGRNQPKTIREVDSCLIAIEERV